MGLQLMSNQEESLSRQSSFREAARTRPEIVENGNSHQAIGAALPMAWACCMLDSSLSLGATWQMTAFQVKCVCRQWVLGECGAQRVCRHL